MERERTIFTKDKRGVAKLILNRPEQLNAFDLKMRAEIGAALDETDEDTDIKILIISGNGRYFGAGLDVKEKEKRMLEAKHKKTIWPAPAGTDDIHAAQVKKITIAALNGPAIGMSCDLALSCDFRIMAESSSLWEAYARLMPPSGGTWLLPRIIGLQRAFEMLVIGDPIDAKTCYEWGLAYKVVPDDQLERAADELAQKILRWSPAIMQFTKASILGGLCKDMIGAMDYVRWTRYVTESLGIQEAAIRAIKETIKEKSTPEYPG